MASPEADPPATGVPPLALLLSLLSLGVPVAASFFFPAWINEDVGILVWLLALIPAFLLSYYRGWKGASLALAAAMAAFTLAQVAVNLLGATVPAPEMILGLVIVLLSVSLGSGLLSGKLHRSLGRAEELALTDAGTGLPNRRHGMLHLRRAFAAAGRGSPLSAILFDLDDFKGINDRFGHATGDRVLRVFAEILQRHTRTMNLSARFGGEEFLTILDQSDADGAALMADRVLTALREHSFAWGRVTASAGVAVHEPGMAAPDVLIAAADEALYRAKAQGGDRAVVLARTGQGGRIDFSPPAPATPGEGRGELVLVVDDDPAVLRTLSRGLLRRRYQPLQANDAEHALQIVRGLDEPLDLVITDVVMPGTNGLELVQLLMTIQPDLRALYISGYDSDEVSWERAPGEVKAFLQKPISLDALTRAVRTLLDTKQGEATPAHDPAAPVAVTEPVPSDPGFQTSVPDLQDRLQASSAQLKEAYDELLIRLAWAGEYRDDVTGRHAERVARLAGMIAAQLGLDDGEAGRIEQAALLHDLGKIAIPDAVLHKPASLTPSEREIMQRHCVIGAHLLAGSRHPLLQEAERIARSHHERWDGTGYPDGLEGEQIPRSARITAVADAFDSMIDTRPYRPAIPRDEAVTRIQADRGTHFDPAVVDAFVALHEAGQLVGLDDVGTAGEWKGPRPVPAGAE